LEHDVDSEGVHTGRYFKEQMDAEWCYAGLCFPWFEDNVHINMIEDKPASKDNEKTVLIDIKKMLNNSKRLTFIEQFGIPKEVTLDDGFKFIKITSEQKNSNTKINLDELTQKLI